MTKRKKAIIIISVIIALIIAAFILILNFLAYGKVVVFRDKSPYNNVEVQIRKEIDYFDVAPRRVFEYEIVVLQKNFIGSSTLLNEEFLYHNDGATLDEDSVDVTWSENHVTVTIHSSRGAPKNRKFVCSY